MTGSGRFEQSSFRRALAGMLLFLFLVKIPGLTYLPVGVVLASIAAPGALRFFRSHGASVDWRIGVLFATGAYGLILQYAQSGDASRSSVEVWFWLTSLGMLAISGAWAFQITGLRRGLILVSMGGLVNIPLLLPSDQIGWKSGLAFPVILLGFTLVRASSPANFAMVLVCIWASLIADYRSAALLVLLTAAMTWLPAPIRSFMSVHPKWFTAWTFVLAPLFVIGATQLFLSGLFGEESRRRTLAQLLNGGSVVLGGRSEWAATWELMRLSPMGYGVGGQPSWVEQLRATSRAGGVGGDVFSDYYPNVVFGPRVDLHSILADLWFHFGILGGALGLFLLVTTISGVARSSIVEARAGAVFVCAFATWDLLFSPMANGDHLALGVALVWSLTLTGRASRSFVKSSSPSRAGAERPTPTPPLTL